MIIFFSIFLEVNIKWIEVTFKVKWLNWVKKVCNLQVQPRLKKIDVFFIQVLNSHLRLKCLVHLGGCLSVLKHCLGPPELTSTTNHTWAFATECLCVSVCKCVCLSLCSDLHAGCMNRLQMQPFYIRDVATFIGGLPLFCPADSQVL